MDATIEIVGPRGKRLIPFADFNIAFMTTAVEPDELLTAVELSPWAKGHGYSFQEFARRHGDFAVVGVATLLEFAGERVTRAALSVCGIATGPVRLHEIEEKLVGSEVDDAAIAQVCAMAREVDAIEDHHASADYRRHLVGVLCARGIREARARAMKSGAEG